MRSRATSSPRRPSSPRRATPRPPANGDSAAPAPARRRTPRAPSQSRRSAASRPPDEPRSRRPQIPPPTPTSRPAGRSRADASRVRRGQSAHGVAGRRGAERMAISRVRWAMVNDISACMPAAESRRTLIVMMPRRRPSQQSGARRKNPTAAPRDATAVPDRPARQRRAACTIIGNRAAETHRYNGGMEITRCGRLVHRRLRREPGDRKPGKVVHDTDDFQPVRPR